MLAIDGDGCFQMTCQELATSATEGVLFIVAVINNGSLGMVRQWQEMFYAGRHSAVDLTHDVPDYAARRRTDAWVFAPSGPKRWIPSSKDAGGVDRVRDVENVSGSQGADMLKGNGARTGSAATPAPT